MFERHMQSILTSVVGSKIETQVTALCSYFKKLWNAQGRSKAKVFARYSSYFDTSFKLSQDILPLSTNVSTGRKKLPFDKCTRATKRRKTADIRNRYQPNELAFATQMKLREVKQKDAADLIQEATQTTPSRASKITHCWRKSDSKSMCSYTDMEALALMVDCDLSVSQYNKLQSGAKIRNANIYPAYHKVLEAKKSCYPADEFIVISETEIEIKLQHLLDITSERIFVVNEDKLINFTDAELLDIQMTYKYGMDGSTGNAIRFLKMTIEQKPTPAFSCHLWYQ